MHSFAAEARVDRSLRSRFRGEDDSIFVSATGIEAALTRFQLTIDPHNRGIRLRRLADIAAGRQSAVVRVDGAPVGVWHSAESNGVLRWAELDFDIPEAFSAGRGAIAVELDASSSPNPWTAFGYTAFSYFDPPSS
jgi:hypothetical protein